MKKILILNLAAVVSFGCSQAAQPTANVNQTAQTKANANQTVQKPGDMPVVSSHSDTQPGSSNQTSQTALSEPGKNTSTESPMAKSVDVAELTKEIEEAANEYKKNPGAKDELAKAYFARAFKLTDAAQYRAALGDFRKGLKLNPTDAEAKAMHDRIIDIFKSIGREPPKEGEEPPPLPGKN